MQIASIEIPAKWAAFARMAHEMTAGVHGSILISFDSGVASVKSRWGAFELPIPEFIRPIIEGRAKFQSGEISAKFSRPIASLSLGSGEISLPDFPVVTGRFIDPIGYRISTTDNGFTLHLRGRVTGFPMTVQITIPKGE